MTLRRVSRRLLLIASSIAMLAAVAIAYSPVGDGVFVWDDHALAERDAAFRHVSIGALVLEPFWPSTPLADASPRYYRPVVLLSLRADLALGGTAAGFHRTNVGAHLVSCLLLMTVSLRLGARRQSAVLSALVWGLTPRLSESVAWIAGRTDVLAGMFGLAAMAVCPRASASGCQPRLRAALSGALLLAALGSKEVALAFAAALTLMTAGVRPLPPRERALRLALSVAAPVLAYSALRASALHGRHDATSHSLGAGQRLATALEALGRYTEMLLDPLRPQTLIGSLGELDVPRAIVGALMLVVGAYAGLRLRSRAPDGVRVALVLAGIALGSVLHLVPFTLAGAVTADRLLYVPLAGVAIAAAVYSADAAPWVRRAASATALCVALLFLGATKARAADYGDEITFWLVAAERGHPRNTTALSALAGLVRDAGDAELASTLYARAATILANSDRAGRSAHRRARENLVGCWLQIGKYDEAARLAAELVREYPRNGRVRMGLAFARAHLLDYEGADAAFDAAEALDPTLAAVIRPARADVAMAREEASALRTASNDGDQRVRYARYLARVGHLSEAEAVYARVSDDPAATAEERLVALRFLATYGHPVRARHAILTAHALPAASLAEADQTLLVRERRYERLARERARLEALGAP